MSNKISLKTLDNYVKEKNLDKIEINYAIGESAFTISVKQSLTIMECSMFVSKVADSCFVDDDYLPEYYDPIFKITFAQIFTNLPIPTSEDSMDIQRAYNYIEALNIVEDAKNQSKNIEQLLKYLDKCIQEKIAFTLSRKTKFDELIDVIIGVVNKLDDSIGDVNIKEFVDKFSSITEVTPESIVQAFTNTVDKEV